jgi:D-glycero-D-manno-heptose 1,7-bisphosphate phosphatase
LSIILHLFIIGGLLVETKAVFLDRDGVVNRAIVRDGKPYSPMTLEELEISPDVPDLLSMLHDAGFKLIIITNQPEVARGRLEIKTLDAIHNLIKKTLPIDDIKVCCHDNEDHCLCRKPAPGLFFDAAAQYQIDLTQSYMIGDRWKDIEAGKLAGCKTVFIDYHYQENGYSKPSTSVSSLKSAVEWILSQEKGTLNGF